MQGGRYLKVTTALDKHKSCQY